MSVNSEQSGPIETPDIHPYFDPDQEVLEFEESDIVFYINDFHRIHLSNAAIIRHYRKDNRSHNCFCDHYRYLHVIFKHYLSYCKNTNDAEGVSAVVRTPPHTQRQQQQRNASNKLKHNRRNRTAFVAQFQPFQCPNPATVKQTNPIANFPTYGVSYEIEMLDDANGENVIQISYRQITRRSFLSMVLGTFERPVVGDSLRHCLVVERANNPTDDANSQNNSGPDSLFALKPCMMPIQENRTSMIDKRVFLVGKHGWLVVFLKNCAEAYLLTENEYLIFSNTLKEVPIFYKRILDMNATSNTEFYYRRTIIEHGDLACNGMIVSRGVIHNEYQEDAFSILGCGNAIVNFTYFQQLLSMPTNTKATEQKATEGGGVNAGCKTDQQ